MYGVKNLSYYYGDPDFDDIKIDSDDDDNVTSDPPEKTCRCSPWELFHGLYARLCPYHELQAKSKYKL